MRLAVALLVLMTPLPSLAAVALDENRAAIVASFVRALTSDQGTELLSVMEPQSERDMTLLVDFAGRYECVAIKSYQFRAEGAQTLRLEMDASAVTTGTAHREVPLPWSWYLEVDCSADPCRLRRAETAEERAARLLLHLPPADWDHPELCPDLDPSRLARALADDFDVVASDEGRFEDAPITPYSVAVKLAREAGDRSTESFVWNLAAWSEAARGHRPISLELARVSMAVGEASGDPNAIAQARFRRGLTLWNGGTYAQDDATFADSCRLLESGSTLVDVMDDPRIGIKSLYMAAYVHRQHGDLRDALLDAERVIELGHRYRWPQGAASAALLLGEMHLSMRNDSLAAESFRAAYKDALQMPGREFVAPALCGLALAQMREGDAAAADENFRRADLTRNWLSGSAKLEVQVILSAHLIRRGRFEEAEERLIGSRDSARHIGAYQTAGDASTLLSQLRLAQRRPAEALAFALEAETDQAHLPVETLDWSRWQPLLAKGKALRALGRGGQAVGALRAAVDAVESQRGVAPADVVASARFFEDRTEPYLELIDLLVTRGRATEAFRYAERMKGRALQDVLAREVDRSSTMLTDAEKEEDRLLTQHLAGLNKASLARAGDRKALAEIRSQIAAARLAIERFEARMEVAHPATRIAHVRSSHDFRFPSDVAGGVVVEFAVGERRTVTFVASGGGGGRTRVVARFVAVTRRGLENRVRRLERQIAARDLRWTRSAAELYALLLGPLDASLRGCAVIGVVPDGVLWRVPFGLLRRDGHELVEHAAVFYAPSLSMLQAKARRRSTAPPMGELIAFGNPTVVHATRDRVGALTRDASLGDLPEAESEVRSIASLWDLGQSRIYLRDAARESVFKQQAPRFRIVHLAAHGILDDRSPMYSAIVLAAGREEADDGLLEAREILDLDLEADLAVLASCDTARGRVGAGEGVIGMSWAFLVAGCPTTVVSQWQADSKATSALMIDFYARLRAGDAPAAALRHAQLAVRAHPRYQDPLYWAPFIVVGAGMRQLSR